MSDRVFDLPVWMTSAWIFNCYVVGAGGRLTVVDPGLPVVANQTVDLVGRLDRSVADVDAVLCTHGHPDHVAGVPTLQGASGCDVLLPGRCARYLDGEQPRTFPLVESSLRFMSVYGEQRFSPRALVEFATFGRRVGFGGPPMMQLEFQPDGFVEDGDAMPSAPGWEVVHAPGHTDDSTCLYHRDSATLISGDAVVTHDGAAWFNPEYVDADVAAATEERLRSLEVRHLLPGHGRPVAASDVWRTAKSFTDPPSGRGVLARCSRRFGRW